MGMEEKEVKECPALEDSRDQGKLPDGTEGQTGKNCGNSPIGCNLSSKSKWKVLWREDSVGLIMEAAAGFSIERRLVKSPWRKTCRLAPLSA